MTQTVEKEQALYHRDEFRTARANASKDAELYDEILFALERLGFVLFGEIGNLGKYEKDVIKFANGSSLNTEFPQQDAEWHTPIERLYKIVKDARNDALHQGAFARHLTTHAIELALILEDALTLMAETKLIRDFMVRGPVCASLWQPLSFVRQQMLVGSFSYLPLQQERDWYLISDFEVARYLSSAPSDTQRKKKLAYTLKNAIADGLTTHKADTLRVNDSTDKFFQRSTTDPALVRRQDEEDIIGIITAYDLL